LRIFRSIFENSVYSTIPTVVGLLTALTNLFVLLIVRLIVLVLTHEIADISRQTD
jgi:hypothetical protein